MPPTVVVLLQAAGGGGLQASWLPHVLWSVLMVWKRDGRMSQAGCSPPIPALMLYELKQIWHIGPMPGSLTCSCGSLLLATLLAFISTPSLLQPLHIPYR